MKSNMKIIRNLLMIAITIPLIAACGKYAGVPEKYHVLLDAAMVKAGENKAELEKALNAAPAEMKEGMAFLIAYMPERDLTSLTGDFLLNNVKLAYEARERFAWAKAVPDSIFFNDVLPYANLKASSLLYDIKRQKPELSLKDGVFVNEMDGYSIKVDHTDKKTGMMYNLMIYNHSDANRNYEMTIADSGRMDTDPTGRFMEVELYHGWSYTDEGYKDRNTKTFPFRRVSFEKQFFLIPLEDNSLKRTDEDLFKNSYGMLDIKQLQHAEDSLGKGLERTQKNRVRQMLRQNYVKRKEATPDKDSVMMVETRGEKLDLDSLAGTMDVREQKGAADKALEYARAAQNAFRGEVAIVERQEEIIRRHQIEWHRKFTLSFACFIFFFIGAPLGGIIRKGGLGMPVVVSIFLFIVYYVIWMMGERAAREGALQPWQGMWIASVILLPLGAFLTYTAMTDSAVMNAEAYTNFMKKVVGVFKRRKK